MDPIDLTGRNALVFGVANHRSIAWGISHALVKRGARLALTYQSERFLDPLEKLVRPIHDSALLIPCDVVDDAQLDACFDTVKREMGHLDILVHSVAGAKREELGGNFRDTSRDGYFMAHDVSAYSLLALAKRAAPLMEGRHGAMLAISYLAAERVVPNYNVMGSAKASLEFIVRQLAFELGPMGIRVNCISAGPVNTLSARGIANFNIMLKHAEEKAPLRRNVTLDDLGRAALFLLSDLSSGVTGETVHVDAGYHILAM